MTVVERRPLGGSDDRRATPRPRRSRAANSLFAATALITPLMAGCGSENSQTVPAALGTVSQSVTANGTLRHVDRVSIGFPEGGKIAQIKVKVGDRVKPGQSLAQVEDVKERVALRKAQAQIKIEEAKLARILKSNSAEAAEDEAEFAEELRDDAQYVRSETIEAEKADIGRIKKRLAFDQRQLERQQEELEEERGCLDDDTDPILPGVQGPSEDCIDRVGRREDAVEAARGTILDTKEDLQTERNELEVARATQRLSVTAAERTEVAEENTEDKTKTDRTYEIEVQRQILEQARADIQLKQSDLEKTFKPSSYEGTVDGIHGQVGQVMHAAHSSPLVPSAGAPAGPAGDKLITLKDVNAHLVDVAFSAADGARITRDQSVEVAFDEVPGLVSPARVADIVAPVPGVNAGYKVTVVLKEGDPRLADGMAARVNIAVEKLENALAVPASAVRINGKIGTVAVQQPDGTVRETPVELGMIGAKAVEIKSGIAAGDLVREKHTG